VRRSRRQEQDAREEILRQLITADLTGHPGSTLQEVSDRLQLPPNRVRALTPEPARRLLVTKRHTDEAEVERRLDRALSALRTASTYEFPLTTTAYARMLAIGEIEGPSVPGIHLLFGSWKHACDLAGIECGISRRGGYDSRWTDHEILAFVTEYLGFPSSPGTFAGYENWREISRPDAPSSGLVRTRLGQWSDVKRRALRHSLTALTAVEDNTGTNARAGRY
jgi:hypothetical protein